MPTSGKRNHQRRKAQRLQGIQAQNRRQWLLELEKPKEDKDAMRSLAEKAVSEAAPENIVRQKRAEPFATLEALRRRPTSRLLRMLATLQKTKCECDSSIGYECSLHERQARVQQALKERGNPR